MKTAIICALILTTSAVSQAQRDDRISLWVDEDRTYCGLLASPGLHVVYIFHTSSEPVAASRFSAPKPECWTNATWLADQIEPTFLSIGNSQTDISVVYSGPVSACRNTPIYVGRIDYFSAGTASPSCCPYKVQPAVTLPAISIVDCFYQEHEASAGSGVVINPTPNCECPVGPPPPPPPPPIENPRISLYGDSQKGACSIVDDQAGIKSVHLFHTGSPSATASQFSAPLPACWTGATFLSDHISSPFLYLGSSQTDLSIAYTTCLQPPIYLGRIDYMTAGTAPTCCEYSVLPAAGQPGIWVADCDFEEQMIGAGFDVIINSTPNCQCDTDPPLPVKETTWGHIKSMYR